MATLLVHFILLAIALIAIFGWKFVERHTFSEFFVGQVVGKQKTRVPGFKQYTFNLCTPGPDELRMALNLIDMNYDALCFGADGITEVCVRELIPYNEGTTPIIYHGMPLRPEFRVFYDFDKHQPLYVVNYWDWDYCHDAICRGYTDKIVYEAYYSQLLDQYNAHKDAVMAMVATNMKNITGLKGIWSVDVLLCESQEEWQRRYEGFWLIDMAIGSRSAYWDPSRIFD